MANVHDGKQNYRVVIRVSDQEPMWRRDRKWTIEQIVWAKDEKCAIATAVLTSGLAADCTIDEVTVDKEVPS